MAMKDLAYSNLELQSHNDGCYFRDPPGLQCFHLLEFQGEGGQTILVDGFKIAEEMKKFYPEEYNILTKTRVTFQYIDDNNHLYQSRPILQLDENDISNLLRVNFNNDDRSSELPINLLRDSHQVGLFYQSLSTFMQLLRDPRFEIQFSMQPSKILVINNWRVLHGRRAFTGHRRLSGCYFNYEDFQSRRRTLLAKIKKTET
jgi:trimethyllysine dioxygenase